MSIEGRGDINLYRKENTLSCPPLFKPHDLLFSSCTWLPNVWMCYKGVCISVCVWMCYKGPSVCLSLASYGCCLVKLARRLHLHGPKPKLGWSWWHSRRCQRACQPLPWLRLLGSGPHMQPCIGQARPNVSVVCASLEWSPSVGQLKPAKCRVHAVHLHWEEVY